MQSEMNLDKIDIMAEPPECEPERQYYYIAKCRQYTKRFFEEKGRYPTACIQNFGCQMNPATMTA